MMIGRSREGGDNGTTETGPQTRLTGGVSDSTHLTAATPTPTGGVGAEGDGVAEEEAALLAAAALLVGEAAEAEEAVGAVEEAWAERAARAVLSAA